MTGRYAIYNHRTNCWYAYGGWIEDSNTDKDVYTIQTFHTLAEAESHLLSGSIYKNNNKEFYTIRKIYF